MCGRYSLISDISALQVRFDFDPPITEHGSRYNIAPTQNVLTVRVGMTAATLPSI